MCLSKLAALALVSLISIGGGDASAATAPTESGAGLTIESIDISAYPQVKVLVAVDGGLAAQEQAGNQFAITENGETREFTLEEIQRAGDLQVVIVFDRSGSMGLLPMTLAKRAAQAFIAALPAEVPVGLVSFSSDETVDVPVTTDREALSTAVNALNSDGRTSLYDAVKLAASQMDPAVKRRVLVVLSDGGDNNSTATLDEAVGAVQGLRVEMIELATKESNRDALLQLSAPLPIRSTDDPAKLEALYQSVAQSLIGRVQITFTSTAEPGSTATVGVTLGNGTELRTAESTFTVPVPATTTSTTTSTTAAPVIDVSSPPSNDGLSATKVLAASLIFLGLLTASLSLRRPKFTLARERLIPKGRGRLKAASKKDPLAGLKSMLERSDSQQKLLSDIATLGLESSPASIVVNILGLAAFLGVLGALLVNLLVGLVLALLVLVISRAVLNNKVRSRREAFIAQLPETLQMLSSMLRTGYGLQQALDAVASEAIEPTRSWLTQILIEVRTGRDLVDALRSLAIQMDSIDFDWVVAGIEISRETGGDLALTMDTVAATIRERDKLRGQIRALTAEGRMSAYVMLALPPGVGILSYSLNPDLASILREPIGVAMLSVTAVLMTCGYFWMRRMIAKVTL